MTADIAPEQPPRRAGRENFRQLIMLRWLAVSGQLATILIVTLGMGVTLPVLSMVAIIGGLVVLNLVSTARLPRADSNRNDGVLGGLPPDEIGRASGRGRGWTD